MGRQDFAFLVSWSPNLLLNFLSEILGHCHSPHSIVRDAALWTLNQLVLSAAQQQNASSSLTCLHLAPLISMSCQLGAAETTKLMNPRVDFEAAVSLSSRTIGHV